MVVVGVGINKILFITPVENNQMGRIQLHATHSPNVSSVRSVSLCQDCVLFVVHWKWPIEVGRMLLIKSDSSLAPGSF